MASVSSALSTVPALACVDGDVRDYLSGLLSDDLSSCSVDSLISSIGPFLESCGVAEGDASVAAACGQIHAALQVGGCIPPPAVGVGKGKPASKSKSKKVKSSSEDALDGGGDDDGVARLLTAPVKLGALGTGATASGVGDNLDFLWGRENNSYLNQNGAMESEGESSRTMKRLARDARKEESRAKFESARAAEEAARAEAASAADGAVSSGTVTYRITEERKAQDLNLPGFCLGYGGELLLDGADLKLVQGRRYGLVGRNGMGKSTLLRHLARGELQGAGAAMLPSNIRILHVEQEISGDGRSVLDTVLASDVERHMLLREEATLLAAVAGLESGATSMAPEEVDAAQARLRAIATRLDTIDAHSAESRASLILAGLQFSPDMQAWPTKSLSGGWRMRVAIACALFVAPEILCLDEPTNHLDLAAVVWLENYLMEYPNTLLIVSHDRVFLNTVATDVIFLHEKKLEYYRGNYDTFERTRAEKQRHAEKAMEAADVRRKHIQSFIDKFRYNAKRASLVQSRIKALERMTVMEEITEDSKWRFEFPEPGALGVPVIQVDGVTFGYDPAKPLIKNATLNIDQGSRIAVVGPNGVGKSTLLKLILGELTPQEGAVIRNPKLRIACFTQHHVNQLDLSLNPVDFMLRMFPGAKPDVLRAHLGSFGMSGELALQRMGTMSGGQKNRVAFAVMSWKKPHILVLDECTNNLDLDSIDAVIVALSNFSGGVILVSHDQAFVEAVAEEIWVVGQIPGRVIRFKGEFKDYRKIAMGEKAVRVEDMEDDEPASGGAAGSSSR